MNKNLLIIGAGIYGLIAKEIAESMECFEKIDFVDDNWKGTSSGLEVVGSVECIESLLSNYDHAVVAIGNPGVRLSLLHRLEKLPCTIATLISPRAYISPSAQIEKGCIIEPMAVVHAKAKLFMGCIVSAGAVVNHASVCEEVVHVDCNATVLGNVVVPLGTKICSGQFFTKD